MAQLPNPDCPALSVNIGASALRRCFDNNYYYVHYTNNSPAESPDAHLTLQLDPFMSIVAAQKPYTSLGNNLFRFDLNTIPPNGSGTFWVRVAVSCSVVLGQTHCTEAHIYPDTLCPPANPGWSGAIVNVSAQCAGDSLHFILKNTGTGAMSQLLDYIVIEDGIMTIQGSAPALLPGETMVVGVPANGATWRIEAAQEPLAPISVEPVLSVEGCTTNGSFSTGFINLFPLGDNAPWLDEHCAPNIGSYDPNDKQGLPSGYGPGHYIRPGVELEYQIRFQNTGTDTAFNVVIRDTLSGWLDPLSIRPGASSHPYNFQLAGQGTLIFDFQHILLPDSNVNESGSHGFVQFRVRPRSDTPLETDILNNAAIYFDFNDPVITNTTAHRIGVFV